MNLRPEAAAGLPSTTPPIPESKLDSDSVTFIFFHRDMKRRVGKDLIFDFEVYQSCLTPSPCCTNRLLTGLFAIPLPPVMSGPRGHIHRRKVRDL